MIYDRKPNLLSGLIFILLLSGANDLISSESKNVSNENGYLCIDTYNKYVKKWEESNDKKRRIGKSPTISGLYTEEDLKNNPEKYQKVVVQNDGGNTYIFAPYVGMSREQMAECHTEIREKYCINEGGADTGRVGYTGAIVQCKGGLRPPGITKTYPAEAKKNDIPKGGFRKNEKGIWVNY